jgi:uroporphyrinogen-III synthase
MPPANESRIPAVDTISDPARPLQGRRIVITRSEDRADSLIERLRSLGAEPLVYPTIAFAPPEDEAPFAAALQRLGAGAYDWLLLTSITGVQVVRDKLATLDVLDHVHSRQTAGLKVAAVGTSTAAACADLLGLPPAVVPEKFVAEALAAALGDLQGQQVLLANADISRPKLQVMLEAAGARIDRVVAYRTVPATGGVDLPPLLAAGEIDAITFTSGSTARYFVQRIGPTALANARRAAIICIGPITAEAAAAVGLPPTVVAATFNETGLVDALLEWVKQGGTDE